MSTQFKTRREFTQYLSNTSEGQRLVSDFVEREVLVCVSSLIEALAKSDDSDTSQELEDADIMSREPNEDDYKEAMESEGWQVVEVDGSFYGIRKDDYRRLHVTELDHTTAVENEHAEDDGEDKAGFYYYHGEPGYMPEGDHCGPYATEDEAWSAALEDEGTLLIADDEDEAIRAVCEDEGITPDAPEVYEHWAVSPWVGRKLADHGEAVGDVFGLTVWGRCTTGQHISMDEVWREVYASIHKDRYSEG